MKRTKSYQYNSNPATWRAENTPSVKPRFTCEISGSLQRIVPMMAKKPGDPLAGVVVVITAMIAIMMFAQGISSLPNISHLTDVLEADAEIEVEIEVPGDAIEQT